MKSAYANLIWREGREHEQKFAAENRLLIWPLRVWTSHGGDSFAVSDHAVLAGVRRIGNRLTIAVRYDNREHTGSLEWDQPPAVEAVEAVLRAHLGIEVRMVGDLKVD